MQPSRAPELCCNPVGESAAAEIAALHRRADPPGWSLDAWRGQLAQPATCCIGGWLDGTLVGFVTLGIAAGEAEVLMIAVDPAHRNAGLARKLLRHALELAAERGAQTCFLEVAVDNAPACALYARCGFSQVAVRKGYYARGKGVVDALVLARPLTRAA
ncbi:ribosomal protein S18-alanine N-acetyltransferase [Tepidamorphus sp. 3E244]|uniref:ribosomal protein S18-alanine N-acetyltransferase n=1 Tax=Tepidamorphus sp. 3E244 TaxID=3385498 RepID=UPI0038FCCB3C